MISPRDNCWRCCICRSVMRRKSLYRHLQSVHKFTKDQVEDVKRDVAREAGDHKKIWRVFCPECGEKFPDHLSLAKHCDEHHQDVGACGQPQDYKVFTKTFDTYVEYERWLSEECERTCSSLSRKSFSGDRNALFLRCNRAGSYVSKSSQRTRIRPTRKQTRNCSCFLQVRMDEYGKVTALGCFGHIGHELDVSLLRLSSMQELFLKNLLERYSMDFILNRLQREYSSNTSRLGCVDRKELWNIANRHQIVPISREHDCPKNSMSMKGDQSRFGDEMIDEESSDSSSLSEDHVLETKQTNNEDSLSLSSYECETSEYILPDDENSLHDTRQNVTESSEDNVKPGSLVRGPAIISAKCAPNLIRNSDGVGSIPSVSHHTSRMTSLPTRMLVPPHMISLADRHEPSCAENLAQSSKQALVSSTRLRESRLPRMEDDRHHDTTTLPLTSQPSMKLPLPVKQRRSAELNDQYCTTKEEMHRQRGDEMVKHRSDKVVVPGKPPIAESVKARTPQKSDKKHGKSDLPRFELWRCKLCRRVMYRKNLYMHLYNVHKFTKEEVENVKREVAQESPPFDPENARIVCPVCDLKVLNHTMLAAHCGDFHKEEGAGGVPQDYNLFTVTFNSLAEFKQWLSEECERTYTTFLRQSSSNGGTTFSLRCNRAGKYETKATKRTCHSRKQAENCSCFMNVRTHSDGTVIARGCFGHAGHDIDVSLLRLSPSQELLLKGLLEEYSMDHILERLKNEYSPQTKLYHVTRSQLWTIINKYNIPTPLKGSRKSRHKPVLDENSPRKRVRK